MKQDNVDNDVSGRCLTLKHKHEEGGHYNISVYEVKRSEEVNVKILLVNRNREIC